MKILIYILFGMFFIFNCSSQFGQQEKNIKRTYYENGNIKAEATYNADSVKHGYGKLFYESGQLDYYAEYKNGKKQGIHKGYYENGSLEFIGYNINNNPVGEQLDYYKHGILKDYLFYDPVGEPHFRRSYDERGKFLDEEGSRNTNIVSITITDNSFEIGDTLQIKVYTPQPPDVKIELKAFVFNNSNKAIFDQQLILDKGQATFSRTLEDTGEFTFKTELTYNDTVQSEISTYENSFQFIVK